MLLQIILFCLWSQIPDSHLNCSHLKPDMSRLLLDVSGIWLNYICIHIYICINSWQIEKPHADIKPSHMFHKTTFSCLYWQEYLTFRERHFAKWVQLKHSFFSHNKRDFSSVCHSRHAGVNSENQANWCYLIVLLNAFIGPKPVKRNGNLSDNSTFKNTH